MTAPDHYANAYSTGYGTASAGYGTSPYGLEGSGGSWDDPDDEVLAFFDPDAPAAPPLPPPVIARPHAPPPVFGSGPLPGWTDRTIKAMGKTGLLREMPNVHHQDEHKHGVKYTGMGQAPAAAAASRSKYRVELGASLTRRTLEFDTAEVHKHFKDKGHTNLGHAMLGKNKAGVTFKLPAEWAKESCIWVCAVGETSTRPVFYSHVCKIQKFHHSSFTAGSGVLGAGEWIVKKGKLLKISANSGHYRPPMDYFYRAVLNMSAAFHGDTTVFLYDTVDDKWIDYPVASFIHAPTMGGRYKTHPDA